MALRCNVQSVKVRTVAVASLLVLVGIAFIYRLDLSKYINIDLVPTFSRIRKMQRFGKITENESRISQRSLPNDCGEICSYSAKSSSPGKYYDFLRKEVNCANMMRRMGYIPEQVLYPPPKKPPPELKDLYIQHGECPITRQFYRIDFNPNKTLGTLMITASKFNDYLSKDQQGLEVGAYPDSKTVRATLYKYREYLENKKGFIVGTEKPWAESILVNLNVSQITTIEYRPLVLEHPKVITITPSEFSENYLNGETELFDFGFSYSSIEHAGLGRYSDPLNPYGDLEAMAQAWCITKPGGIYILGLGVGSKGKCYIEWNAHRMYGTVRLKHLTANWEVIDEIIPKRFNHHIWVLKKPIII